MADVSTMVAPEDELVVNCAEDARLSTFAATLRRRWMCLAATRKRPGIFPMPCSIRTWMNHSFVSDFSVKFHPLEKTHKMHKMQCGLLMHVFFRSLLQTCSTFAVTVSHIRCLLLASPSSFYMLECDVFDVKVGTKYSSLRPKHSIEIQRYATSLTFPNALDSCCSS